MTLETLIIISIGAFLGGFVNGLAGFGTALFALGWWLQVMPPAEAVGLCLAVAIISGLPGLRLIWKQIEPGLLARFVIPAMIGIPIGAYLLTVVNAQIMILMVAVFLIIYGGFYSLRSSLPQLQDERPKQDAAIGFAGGVLGGLAGLSGALPTIWLSMRGWPKGRTRGLLQPFNMIVLIGSVFGIAFQGGYNSGSLMALLWSLPATLLGVTLGILLYSRLSDSQFRRLLIALLFASGCILLGRVAPHFVSP